MNEDKIIVPRTFSEELLYITTKIATLDNNERVTGSGTGFFFQFEDSDRVINLILTNKHVVEGAPAIQFYFHEAIEVGGEYLPNGKFFTVNFRQFTNHWIPHPNPNIDLGAILLDPVINTATAVLKKTVYYRFFTQSFIKSDMELKELTTVAEDVLMIGYPKGLRGEASNFPIIRKGITAYHPALDFNEQSLGVVDIACFCGSSGSPIIIFQESYTDKNGNYVLGKKFVFLGLLSSGPYHLGEGKIGIRNIPTANSEYVAQYQQMIHLGYYVKAKEILALHSLAKQKLEELAVKK